MDNHYVPPWRRNNSSNAPQVPEQVALPPKSTREAAATQPTQRAKARKGAKVASRSSSDSGNSSNTIPTTTQVAFPLAPSEKSTSQEIKSPSTSGTRRSGTGVASVASRSATTTHKSQTPRASTEADRAPRILREKSCRKNPGSPLELPPRPPPGLPPGLDGAPSAPPPGLGITSTGLPPGLIPKEEKAIAPGDGPEVKGRTPYCRERVTGEADLAPRGGVVIFPAVAEDTACPPGSKLSVQRANPVTRQRPPGRSATAPDARGFTKSSDVGRANTRREKDCSRSEDVGMMLDYDRLSDSDTHRQMSEADDLDAGGVSPCAIILTQNHVANALDEEDRGFQLNVTVGQRAANRCLDGISQLQVEDAAEQTRADKRAAGFTTAAPERSKNDSGHEGGNSEQAADFEEAVAAAGEVGGRLLQRMAQALARLDLDPRMRRSPHDVYGACDTFLMLCAAHAALLSRCAVDASCQSS
ncbi:hypothetical protein CYMTET_26554 [Cymbomonas tetramitiformis]|uniref:Uncharacterized protein n=1 Tax=Cymbomonas tetramitiformis TaxID=36881 RepID=A0AAE0KXX1_9CHLO|nr:hypothetical protein CYMTET_26554 [Cymbomonas tetramitiformis]